MKERREKINKYIMEKGFVSISELSEIFSDISTMTIRRDLEFLEERGDIVRTTGGAKSIIHLSMKQEDAYHNRESTNLDLKIEISEKTKNLIEDNSCVFLDSGSTVMLIAKSLGDKPIFAITSGPNIAMELLKNPNSEVSMIGGKLSRDNISLSGMGAVEFIKGINIGTAVIAASGFSFDYGFSCGNFDECQLKNEVIKIAKKIIVVMDSTKFGKNHPFTFANTEDIDYFVTDKNFDRKSLANIKKLGIKVV